MDARFEPPRMGLRRVSGGDTQFISRPVYAPKTIVYTRHEPQAPC